MSNSANRSIFHRSQWFACVALGCLMALGQSAIAQQYTSIPVKVSGSAARQLSNKASSARRDAASYAANKGALDQYYLQFFFPSMTSYRSQDLARLGKGRDALMRDIRGAKVPAAQKQILDIAFKTTQSISRGDYHPAVRYNAVLILGALDDKQGTKTTPPVPRATATKSLLELLENDQFENVKVPTSLKVGALVGLERHAHCGIPEETATQVTKAALKVIAQEEPAADVSPDVHHWMQCQAARVLTRLYEKKPNPQVQTALVKMINNGNLSLEDRCSIAALLFRMEYANAEGIELAETASALGNLLKQVVQEEAQLARDFEKIMLGGPRGRTQGMYNKAEPVYQRNRLVSRLWSIGRGGTSIMAGLPDDVKTQVSGYLKPVGEVVQIAADKDSVELNITQAVQKLERELNTIIK